MHIPDIIRDYQTIYCEFENIVVIIDDDVLHIWLQSQTSKLTCTFFLQFLDFSV